MSKQSTTEKIVVAADLLFYQQGYQHTSFSEIARLVNISKGNFYYHFKSKDQILAAVIHLRLAKTHTLLRTWENNSDNPHKRIAYFIDQLLVNQQDIMAFGCPTGTLCAELTKLKHPAYTDAKMVFTLFRTWLRRQFVDLQSKATADQHAMHLLTRYQGVATLISSFNDQDFFEYQFAQMHQWLTALPSD